MELGEVGAVTTLLLTVAEHHVAGDGLGVGELFGHIDAGGWQGVWTGPGRGTTSLGRFLEGI